MYEYDDNGRKPQLQRLEGKDQEVAPYGFDGKGRVTFRGITNDQHPLITTKGEPKEQKKGKALISRRTWWIKILKYGFS